MYGLIESKNGIQKICDLLITVSLYILLRNEILQTITYFLSILEYQIR